MWLGEIVEQDILSANGCLANCKGGRCQLSECNPTAKPDRRESVTPASPRSPIRSLLHRKAEASGLRRRHITGSRKDQSGVLQRSCEPSRASAMEVRFDNRHQEWFGFSTDDQRGNSPSRSHWLLSQGGCRQVGRCQCRWRIDYSWRRACMGLMREARRAGP
jgi:hypothetical protein